MNTSITGKRTVKTTNVGEVEVREVPLRRITELYALTDMTRGAEPTDQCIGQIKLFTGLTDEQIDTLSHAEAIDICEVGLEVNAAFFSSFGGAMRRQIDAMLAKAAGATAPSPSQTGSSTGAQSPA